MLAGVGRVAVALAIAVGLAAAPVAAQPEPPPTEVDVLAEAARSCEPGAVAALVAALPRADADEAADALFTTARKCETAASDPAAALALYQRILHDYPDSRASVGAGLKVPELTALIGPDGKGAENAHRLAALKAHAGTTPDAATLAEAEALGRAAWPGAGEAALWRADRLRELMWLGSAAAAYDDVLARFPATAWARRAAEGAAAVAISANRFDDARRRIAALPTEEPADRAVRDDLAEQLDIREVEIAWFRRSIGVLVVGILLLLGSLVHAARSGRAVLRALRPPAEVMFATPIVVVLIGMSLTTHYAIGPAVAVISGGGLVLAWLSAAGLTAARTAGKPIRTRAIAHAAITVLAVAALAYVAVMRGDLLEMIRETVRFGPEP